MPSPVVIIPCGGKKRTFACQARLLYVGAYHVSCQRYALTLTSPEKVFILSALYGLLDLWRVIAPYDLRMGSKGAITSNKVREQANLLGILDQEVIALGGRDYTKVCAQVWSNCSLPLEGRGGIGKQLKWLKEQVHVEIREDLPV